MPNPTPGPALTGSFAHADAVLRALDRYRDALRRTPAGTPPPDAASFAAGLSVADAEQFRAEVSAGGTSRGGPPTVTLAPEGAAPDTKTGDYTPASTTDDAGAFRTASFDDRTQPPGSAGGDGDFQFDRTPRSAGGGGPADRLTDYEILGELGAGGMGVVYKARQKKLNRVVALKMVLAGGRATPMQLARFQAEALAVARLDHPNIVQVYDIGDHDGLPFFAMEFVDGGGLDRKLDRKPMEPPPAARLLEAVARAVHHAHGRGVIHRDLKPANILVAADGTPKVTDFGLAKLADDGDGVTRTGVVMGTPNYMAPEQAEGQSRHVTHLADVYALGATLYEMVTGRPPFQGPSAVAVIAQVRSAEPVNPGQLSPGLPKDLETITLKCLQKEPGRRYATAEELADDLGRFLRGEPIVARPISSVEKVIRWCRRKPREASLTLTAAGLVAALFVGSVAAAVVFRAKNGEITRRNVEIAGQNVALADERDAVHRVSDYNAEQVRFLVRDLAYRLKTLGLTRERQKLVEYLLTSIGKMERLTEEGAGIADRARVSGYVQIGELYAEVAQADRARAAELLPKAEEYFQKAHDIAVTLADARPESDLARGNLALAKSRLARSAQVRGETSPAGPLLADALRLRQDIVDAPKSTAGSRDALFPADALASLAESHAELADLADLDKKPAEARPHRVAALDLRKRALALVLADPKATEAWIGADAFRSRLAASHMQEAWASFAKDRPAAEAHAEEALRLLQAVAEADDDALPAKREVASVLFFLGARRLTAGDPAKAKQYFDKMYAVVGRVLRQGDEATSRDNRWTQSLALYGVGVAEAKLGNRPKATAAFRDCVRLRDDLAREEDRPRYSWGLMVALARAGDAKRAVEVLRQEKARDRNPDDFWFNAACTYSLAAESVGGWQPDAALTPDQRREREGYTTEALAAVDQVIRLKSRRAAEMTADPDLEYLQTLPRFRDLIKQIPPAPVPARKP